MDPLEITVCMGSACFSRGNARIIPAIQDCLKELGFEKEVIVTGTLCQNRCKQGPNLSIGGEIITGVELSALPRLLEAYLGKRGRVGHELPEPHLH